MRNNVLILQIKVKVKFQVKTFSCVSRMFTFEGRVTTGERNSVLSEAMQKRKKRSIKS